MNKNFLFLLGVVVIVGIVSALFTYFRSDLISLPGSIS